MLNGNKSNFFYSNTTPKVHLYQQTSIQLLLIDYECVLSLRYQNIRHMLDEILTSSPYRDELIKSRNKYN